MLARLWRMGEHAGVSKIPRAKHECGSVAEASHGPYPKEEYQKIES